MILILLLKIVECHNIDTVWHSAQAVIPSPLSADQQIKSITLSGISTKSNDYQTIIASASLKLKSEKDKMACATFSRKQTVFQHSWLKTSALNTESVPPSACNFKTTYDAKIKNLFSNTDNKFVSKNGWIHLCFFTTDNNRAKLYNQSK